MSEDRICVGAFAGAFGVRGEVRLKSFCTEPEDITTYGPLWTEDEQSWEGEGMVVTRMARDLDIPITVHGCETVREPSGLAMSSRNLLLPKDRLAKAAALNAAMREAAAKASAGEPWAPLETAARQTLAEAGFGDVEYFDLRCAETLEALDSPTLPARLLAAAWMDGVRLIRLSDVLCASECKVQLDGQPIYLDDDHLADPTSVKVFGPYLAKEIFGLKSSSAQARKAVEVKPAEAL